MGIFSSLNWESTPWKVVDSRHFTSEEIENIFEAYVVYKNHVFVVEFIMIDGSYNSILLDSRSSLEPGDYVDVNKAEIITLSKPGEDNIQRIRI